MIGQRRHFAHGFIGTVLLILLGSAFHPRIATAQVTTPSKTDAKNAINFPTSGPAAAQNNFLVGVELLHNFEYLESIEIFSNAIKAHPDFAMAYWGLAMSYNHPLWEEQDLESARGVLKDLDKVPTANITPREKGFLDAVRVLYGDGDKPTRDTNYAEAMRKLYVQFPKDDEVAAFYGLAMLGTQEGKRDFRVAVKASGVLEPVYLRNPNHPGVLHYLVHCYDDPSYASLGLDAADRYELVAGNSAHALHMPSHIYLALGMWTQYVQTNEASWAASQDRIRRKHLGQGDYDIHALHTLQWLEYGYLQQGRVAKAMDCLKAAEKIENLNPSPMMKWYLAMMRAAYVVDSPNWQDVIAAPDLKGVELTAPASSLYANGLMAIREKTPGAQQAITQIGELIEAGQHADSGPGLHEHASFFTDFYNASVKPANIMQAQLRTLQLLADGKNQEAVNLLENTVADEAELTAGYGPPVPVKPSAELLGEVYLNQGRPQNAMRAFQIALLRYPNRAASLVGLVEAARLAGDSETETKAKEKLAAIQGGAPSPYQAWKQLP